MLDRTRATKPINSAHTRHPNALVQKVRRYQAPQTHFPTNQTPASAQRISALLKRILAPSSSTRKASPDAISSVAPGAPQILPVERKRPEIKEALKRNKVVFIRGATGSGKSTITPRIALEVIDEAGGVGSVAHMVPRRILASELGVYTSALMGEPTPGGTVGWAHALRRQISDQSRIKFFTNGVYLMQRLRHPENPAGVKILDEFHVGALEQDIVYALHLKDMVAGRSVPRLAILSATMNAEAIRNSMPFQEKPPIIDCEGRLFPIGQRAAGESPAADAVEFVRRGKSVIVFLYGRPAIEEVDEEIQSILESEPLATNVHILHLHSQLSPEQQALAFQIYDCPKIILATDAGEVGVTIPGIQAVVCSGLCRSPSFDPLDGSLSLLVGPTSQRSIAQQIGRGGRTEVGEAVIHVEDVSELALEPAREITQVPLEDWVLRLMANKEPIEGLMDYLPDPPSLHQIRWASHSLRALGLISQLDEPTPLGKRVANLPVGVHSGKLLAMAHDQEKKTGLQLLAQAIDVAAIQEAQGITSDHDTEWHRLAHNGHGSDALAQVEALYNGPREAWKATCQQVLDEMESQGHYIPHDFYRAVRQLKEIGGLSMLIGRPEVITHEQRLAYEEISRSLREQLKDAFFGLFARATKEYSDSRSTKLAQMGLSPTNVNRAMDIRDSLRRKFAIPKEAPVAKVLGAERDHLQHLLWSSNIDRIFRRVREDDAGNVYYQSIYGGPHRQISRGSVVANAPFIVGRPINIGSYDSKTGEQEVHHLISMVSLITRKWLEDGYANLPGRHEVRDALSQGSSDSASKKRRGERNKQFIRPDTNRGRGGPRQY
jgi:HrpA-like RNA helicase